MRKNIIAGAKFSRAELNDVLVGVNTKQARIDALHSFVLAATQMIEETAGAETADACLLSSRFSALGRGSRSLKETANVR